MTTPPHELDFVLDVPTDGVLVDRTERFDRYRPDPADGPRPAVIFVPGPIPADWGRPRDWPVYAGYGRLAARRGLVGIVAELGYHRTADWPTVADRLAGLVEAVRADESVDGERIGLWAFSAGGLPIAPWLADSPGWLRCLALTYPLLRDTITEGDVTRPEALDLVRPGRPILLTRAGRETEQRAAVVAEFLDRAAETGTAVRIIDVPNGRHGFDMLDHTEESREAVLDAMSWVATAVLGR